MDFFNVIVGVFTILGAIATFISAGVLLHIEKHINQKGENNTANNITQFNLGKDNKNSNTIKQG